MTPPFPDFIVLTFWSAIRDHLLGPTRLNRVRIRALLVPAGRDIHLRRHAASVIIARVQLISALFAILVPLWSVVDLAVIPPATAGAMFLLRLASALVFVALAWPRELSSERPYTQAVLMLLTMLMLPPLFYLLSLGLIDVTSNEGGSQLVTQLYAYMPTIVLGGLAIFPLTALETLLFALPVLCSAFVGLLLKGEVFTLAQHGATLWFMTMMLGVAMFSGMSQCHYMATLVYKAATDPLTSAYTRNSGTEALELLFRLASMGDRPLTVIFFDLDHFKSVNDQHGHEAGDQILRETARGIREALRRSDILIRWGGEEFIAVLPDTPASAISPLLVRLRRQHFGLRPDGTPVTASIGVADSLTDAVNSWNDLVNLADQRMYAAKHAGRDCAVLPGEVRLDLAAEIPAEK